MQLIGYLDSPFVRRTAITMRLLGIEYEHRELSIFRNFEEFRQIHPSVKVPTLVTDEGDVLIDSTLIIQVGGTGEHKNKLKIGLTSKNVHFRHFTWDIRFSNL